MCNIARALADFEWDVHVLCPEPSRGDEQPVLEGDATYHSFPYPNPSTAVGRLTGSVRGFRRFRSTVRSVGPDVILDDISHVPYYPAHFFSRDATNSVFMHTAFFNEAWTFNGPVKGTVVNLIDRFLPYMNDPEVICASESTKRRITDRTRITDGHILNPCIDITEFEYEFSTGSERILYLGRLTPRKNVSCLVKAWAEVESNYGDYTLSIAGTGPREESLKDLARRLGIDNIEFHGYVDEAEKRRLYGESLLFVVPSLMEGYMTTGIEALASGTPVVGSDTYGIHDYVRPEKNGYLFEPDDERDLTETLQAALSNPEALRPLAENGRDVAEDHTFEKFKVRARDVFEQLV